MQSRSVSSASTAQLHRGTPLPPCRDVFWPSHGSPPLVHTSPALQVQTRRSGSRQSSQAGSSYRRHDFDFLWEERDAPERHTTESEY